MSGSTAIRYGCFVVFSGCLTGDGDAVGWPALADPLFAGVGWALDWDDPTGSVGVLPAVVLGGAVVELSVLFRGVGGGVDDEVTFSWRGDLLASVRGHAVLLLRLFVAGSLFVTRGPYCRYFC